MSEGINPGYARENPNWRSASLSAQAKNNELKACIAELEAENKRLRDALGGLLAELERSGHGSVMSDPDCWVCREITKARIKLEGKNEILRIRRS